MLKDKLSLLVTFCCGVALVFMVAATGDNYRPYNLLPSADDYYTVGDATYQWNAYLEDLYVDGDTQWQYQSVSLTSPTKSFSVAGITIAEITTDVAQTGVTLTGGVLGQVVHCVGTHTTNTVLFTDAGTTFALGGDVTLADSDTLTVMCTDATNQHWAKIGGNDN